MIKFEHGMLVLDSSATLEDMRAVSEFQEYVRNKEQERIIKLLDKDITECTSKDCDFCNVSKDLIARIKGEYK